MSQTGQTASSAPTTFGGASAPRSAGSGGFGALVGRAIPWFFVVLFLVFVLAFLIAPTLVLVVKTFTGDHGFTLSYLTGLWDYQYRIAFQNSIILGLASAFTGLIGGFFIAYTSLQPGAPAWLRSIITSFAAVAANFAGVPLAFAFISTLGSLGFVTIMLKHIGVDIYAMGFSLYSLTGMTVTFAYFQIPLMLIIITPAIQGLRLQWREASEGLGATSWQYWRLVGLPILTPSLLGGFLLLFGSAFSAYATPYALTDGNIALVTIDISNVLSGNVMSDPQVGAALSTGMILVMTVVLAIYSIVSRYSARWRR
ncbi:MAG TPA: ABC transporter permease [Acidisoma sp.]|uniref:ABC transporter permease n=1 Tax=Acidisoma sp. TaxID=1872115 RepID=UPI002BDB9AE2|nr:ABC transporter permease [Acidisoma sp.]HTI02259.1 ABC transporter permease [Acidisoma sp.]